MRTQEQIQYDISELIGELYKRKASDSSVTLGEVISGFPDIKEKWDAIMKEVEELKAKGVWRTQ